MPKITKAVVAVAGSGTRLLPATKSMPKEMLPIVDKPIIQLIVEELDRVRLLLFPPAVGPSHYVIFGPRQVDVLLQVLGIHQSRDASQVRRIKAWCARGSLARGPARPV